jgi:hypothetical protein
MSNNQDRHEFRFILCKQCGIIIPYIVWYKRKTRNQTSWDHCKDCIAIPRKTEITIHPTLGRIECHPYTGEVNESWQPIDGVGDLYLPGARICGHSDCVNEKHIQKPEVKTISEIDRILGLHEIQDFNRRRKTA